MNTIKDCKIIKTISVGNLKVGIMKFVATINGEDFIFYNVSLKSKEGSSFINEEELLQGMVLLEQAKSFIEKERIKEISIEK